MPPPSQALAAALGREIAQIAWPAPESPGPPNVDASSGTPVTVPAGSAASAAADADTYAYSTAAATLMAEDEWLESPLFRRGLLPLLSFRPSPPAAAAAAADPIPDDNDDMGGPEADAEEAAAAAEALSQLKGPGVPPSYALDRVERAVAAAILHHIGRPSSQKSVGAGLPVATLSVR